MTRRFLLIGVDGVRHDRLMSTATPNIDAIAARGFLSTAQIPVQNPTMSGAQWATILTGVWSPEHGVKRNWLGSRKLARHPDLLQLVQRREPQAAVFAAVSWPPLAVKAGCGPVLRTPAFLPQRRVTTLASWKQSDEAVVEHSVERLRDLATTAGFVYIGQVDMAGHLVDTGPRYVEALEEADRMVGRLVEAIESTGQRDEWTIMVTTDHGHREAGGHGGRSAAETTVWFACDTALPGWERLDSAGVRDYLLSSLDLRQAPAE